MPDSLYIDWTKGKTIYGVLRRGDQQVWNTATPAFETYNGTNWASYAVAATEQTNNGASGRYVLAIPSGINSSQILDVAFVERAGASPSLANDLVVGGDRISWTGSAIATAGDATAANQTTILARLGSFTGGGDNTLLGFLRALMSKTAATPSDVGGTFNPATDSVEAIKDLGVAAVAGAVGSVSGDVAGKILGGGSGTITGTGVRADDRDGSAIAKASSLTTVGNDVLEVLDRLGAFAGSGINTVLGFFQALFRSDMTIPTNIGGTYHPALHSLEALRARGDAAWYATPGAVLLETTISSLTNQTLFALSAGSSDNTAYVGALAIIAKSGSPTRKCFGVVAGYSGGTRTVVLAADPAIFTIAVGDAVTMIAQTELTAAGVWQHASRSLTQAVEVGSIAGSGEAALVMAALYGTGATRTTVSTAGTPAAGAFSAADLDDSPVLSEEDDFYKGQLLVFTSGPNVGANRKISGYVAATRTFTFAGAAGRSDAPFDFAPTADDAFVVLGRVG